MQAELICIETVSEFTIWDKGRKRKHIYSDSRAALTTLWNMTTESNLILERQNKLNSPTKDLNAQMLYIFGHNGIGGKEIVDGHRTSCGNIPDR